MVALAASYEYCRRLHRDHGRTYYLATRMLPRWKRRHVHALYGFTRFTDDIVDVAGPGRADRLAAWTDRYRRAVDGEVPDDDPVLPALVHTVSAFGLDRCDLDAFLASMRMDLTVTSYPEYEDLLAYMEGSAAVIGTLTLPILLADGTPVSSAQLAAARGPARELGLAFQLTNFIRDVAADRALGRVYLPQADLTRFGVTDADLLARRASPALRRLVAFEVARAREHYRAAAPGVALLPARSRRCIRLAMGVYGGILDEVERADYDVLVRRASVPPARRAAATLRELLTAP